MKTDPAPPPAWLAALAVVVTSACGVQATTGWQAHSDKPALPFTTVGLGARVIHPRSSGPYAGVDTMITTPIGREHLALRQVVANTGWRFVGQPFTLEVGADMGAGQPALEHIGGTGFYLGAALAPLVRLYGKHDREPGYAVGGVLWDLVLVGRLGVWGRPEGNSRSEVFDGGLHIGIRWTGVSDLPFSDNDGWVPP
jgi:hypothetical protein